MKEFTVDDKGCVLVVAFGVPPLVHSDEPSRAVRAAVEMAREIEGFELEYDMGITTGTAFCASVGSRARREVHRCLSLVIVYASSLSFCTLSRLLLLLLFW